MEKEDVVRIYNGILLSHKKEGNNAIYNNIDESIEIIILSELIKTNAI